MDRTATDRIDAHGDPLAFKFREGRASPAPRHTFVVEARQMAGHQKEAVVTEGEGGPAWRLTSDEGAHLKGTDLAPFPLGFFNAGLQSDLYREIHRLAGEHGIKIDELSIRLVNHYWLTGSFVHGTGEGHAEAPDIDVAVRSSAARADIESVVAAALAASPAMAFLATALASNTFGLYINGRRHEVPGVENPELGAAPDPFRTYSQAPRPPVGFKPATTLIEKTPRNESGTPEPASATPTGKVIRNIFGEGRPFDQSGLYEVDTWLGLPGMTHFRLVSDEGNSARAPTGLALLSAGISFCYMTQLARYIESMKMKIGGVRLVQYTSFERGKRAKAGAIDTHLFLNGEAPPETHVQLLTVAARTCYLHAAAKTPVDPIVRVTLNGEAASKAA